MMRILNSFGLALTVDHMEMMAIVPPDAHICLKVGSSTRKYRVYFNDHNTRIIRASIHQGNGTEMLLT